MTRKYILAIVLLAPLITAPAMAQYATDPYGYPAEQYVYQGGPKTNIPPATRYLTGANAAYAMMPFTVVPPAPASPYRYYNRPRTVVPRSGY
jgi:hypothetical protein